MSDRFTITVSDEMGDWVDEAADSDKFGSKSEVAQEGLALLRRLQEEDADLDDLLDARDAVDELEDEIDRLDENHEQELEELHAGHEREVAEYERELERVREEHEQETQHLQARVDDLQRQLAEANRRIDTTNELVRYVENERTAEQRRREASVLTRTKWWLTGMPDDRDE